MERIPGAAALHNQRYVRKRLDIVDQRGLIEQPALRGKRRLGPRLAAFAFERVHQRGLFAADIRAAATPNLSRTIAKLAARRSASIAC